MNQQMVLPDRLLSNRYLLGQSLDNPSVNPRLLAHFSDDQQVLNALSAARAEGCGGVLGVVDHRIVSLCKKSTLPFFPVVPNVMGYVREATHSGVVRAGLQQLWKTGVLGVGLLGLRFLASVGQLTQGDFSAVIRALIALEMRQLRKFHPPVVFLHPTTVDLALAFNNWNLIEQFCHEMRYWHTLAGVATTNSGGVLPWLDDAAEQEIKFVLTPINREGFLMNPDQEICHQAIRQTERTIVAERVAPFREFIENDQSFLETLGIRCLVLEGTVPNTLLE